VSNWQLHLRYNMPAVSTRDAHSLAPRKSTTLRDTNLDEADIIFSWLVYKIVDIVRYRAVQAPAVIATGIVTNVFIIISVLSAFPWVRKSVISLFFNMNCD
jgi:hypothetical protein